MAEKKPAKKSPRRSTRSTSSTKKESTGFTAEERAAMRERAREQKAGASKEGDEAAVLAKLATMSPSDRVTGERIHAIVMSTAPGLSPRTWYGMPAYAKDGTVVCFFQGADKFKVRYSTLGFSDRAALDEGDMWPTSFALKELNTTVEARIAALVKRAVG